MILILTMAGRYQRFADEGYKMPKYLLPWGERTILWTILSELVRDGAFHDIHLVGNHRDEGFMPHVRAIMRDCGIDRKNLRLVADTSGQAETASLGIEMLHESQRTAEVPIVFHNVDTILYGRNIGMVATALGTVDGYVDVFSSSDHAYSYVLADDNRRVLEIAEKIVVSGMATSGFYGFANADMFSSHFDPSADRYISSVYKRMIDSRRIVAIGETHDETDTIVLGTPNDYLNASLLRFA